MNDRSVVHNLNKFLSLDSADLEIKNLNVNKNVTVDIEAEIDITYANNDVVVAGQDLEKLFESSDYGYDVDVVVMYKTSMPTLLPSKTPSFAPVTAYPSSVPTRTVIIFNDLILHIYVCEYS